LGGGTTGLLRRLAENIISTDGQKQRIRAKKHGFSGFADHYRSTQAIRGSTTGLLRRFGQKLPVYSGGLKRGTTGLLRRFGQKLPVYSGGLKRGTTGLLRRFGQKLPVYSGDWGQKVPVYSGGLSQKYRSTQAINAKNVVFLGSDRRPLMMIINLLNLLKALKESTSGRA
jgi:hypothetical protein